MEERRWKSQRVIDEIIIKVPVRILSEGNIRDHWSRKHKRNKELKRVIKYYLNLSKKPRLPCKIILTRVSPRLLDIDNLWSSLKYPIDIVCDWLIPGLKPGQADSDKRIEIVCSQKKCKMGDYAPEVVFLRLKALKQE